MFFLLTVSLDSLLSVSFTLIIFLPFRWFEWPEFFSIHEDLSGEIHVDMTPVVNYLFSQSGICLDDLAKLPLIFEDSL